MIDRPHAVASTKKTLQRSPITALLGPRQCGKITLARLATAGEVSSDQCFDLETHETLDDLMSFDACQSWRTIMVKSLMSLFLVVCLIFQKRLYDIT